MAGTTSAASSETGAPRPDRTVAMFYFLWHEAHWPGPFDISKILAKDPDAMSKSNSPLWGPLYAPHHWGKSIFGYYLGDDESVLRKHAQMLGDAGVDVIIFDASNKVTYRQNYLRLFEVFAQMRKAGNRVPQVAFLTPFGDPRSTVNELYEQIYSKNLHENLWFRWEGKPLILADPKKVDAGPLGFFTFRKPQPDYFQGPTRSNMWSWLEVFPQHVFRNSRDEKEQMSVGVAQNAVENRLATMSEKGARGRSFHGDNYGEQWEHALKEDPRVIFITGWNEWIAGRFDVFNGVAEPVMFVDQFDREHSRDIEPMQGGHGDAYFYRTVDFIRRYKGARTLPAVGAQRIRIDGKFRDWQNVTPEYRDTVGDPVHRNHPGWGNVGPYVNQSGRNDLVAAKVSYDAKNIYFYARTKDPLTPSTDPNWMLLYIDADQNPKTGWLGYDFVLNRTHVRSKLTTLERCQGNAGAWGNPVDIDFRAVGNEVEIAIPRAALGLAGKRQGLDFKWADNIQQTGDASGFTLNGDAAPNDRFNFRARFATNIFKADTVTLPARNGAALPTR